jgi:uncharacterized protein
VAISRAQWATYLLHSPTLADFLPGTPDGLLQLGAYLRLHQPSSNRQSGVTSKAGRTPR